MGGRISDIAIDPRNPFVFYVALGHGGVFKSTDSGELAGVQIIFFGKGSKLTHYLIPGIENNCIGFLRGIIDQFRFHAEVI